MKEKIEEDSKKKKKKKFTKSAWSKKFFERAQHKCIMLGLLFDNGRKNVDASFVKILL
jgi:hypothetical protein